ncbi:malonic semialdehyde reductase [Microbulbifer sp. OS29]|uniref:Putative NADH dehydrogenase/NAD(P)H nitroreductase MO867_11395 n=1 Tax=Microbulbifer okhotskensis TaxID=2926617 RepID=A0A9X2ESH2_9GAMM|nr:malonic semialdehyde reductase [Microbulbifer okhotskensis]MCO1334943.1 malonic semialdehyde reductase [Microbulbifer okhotskensis]
MQAVSSGVLDQLFNKARTHSHWQERSVAGELLKQLYEAVRFGPTSANCFPMRLVFLQSRESKERLKPALNPGNVEKTMQAPVTAIIAYDIRFYEYLPRLYPQTPAREWFSDNPEYAEETAFRNGSLQGGYFILAARALGLDCGPMSGFDNAFVDHEFFSEKSSAPTFLQEHCPDSHIKSNFLCNLGYGESSKLHPRNPRFEFDEVCRTL